MSNAEQFATVVVGTAIGFATGNPALGFQIGLVAGSLLFPLKPPTQFGPRMTDIQTTAATLGAPVGITYGTFAVPGQVMAVGCVTEIERVDKVGGKGGPPEQKFVNYEYTQTIAVGLCEGIICGLLRVWENGELVYDVREQQLDEDAETYAARLEMSGQYATTFTLYIGDEVQEPDPDLEVVFGVGMVPGFRGLAYIVYPDRRLQEDQALRHPQWRFEVVRGTGERGVVSPTLLDGPLDGFQLPVLLPDWPHNRYFTMDNVGGSAGYEAEGIRAFSIRSNTEYLQRTYADIGIVEPIAIYRSTVGIDGFLYICIAISNDDGVIYKLDPVTLDIVAEQPMGLFQNQWLQALTTTATALGLTAHFVISVSVLGNHFKVRRADSLGELATFGDGRESGFLCRGPSGGETAIIYALSCDEGSSGVNDGIDVLRITCGISFDVFLNIIPVAEIETVGTIPHSDLQSDWVRVSECGGLVYDESDDTIIFAVTGANHTGITPVTSRIIKMNPETLEVIWNVEDTTGHGPTFDDNQSLSRIVGGEYVLGASLSPNLIRLDLETGEQVVEDWSGFLPGNQTISGAEIWDGVTGCLLTYITDIGPVLICDQICTDEGITLGEIVEDVCLRTGVPDDGYDVSELTHIVHGYGVMRNMPGREAIEVLRPVGSFDSVESGTVIKFPVRGRAVTKTYDDDELSAHFQGESAPPAVTTTKTQSVELPRIVRVHYIAPSRDYEPGEKLSPSRFSPEIENELDIEVPVAIDDSQAMQIAEIVQADTWAGRWQHNIIVDVGQLAREPTDVVLVPIDGRLYRCRIVEVDDVGGGLLRKLSLVRDDDGSYVSVAVSDPPLQPVISGPRLVSESALILLDLPPLREQDDDAGIYGVAYRETPNYTWGGAVVSRSNDNGATWGQMTASTTEGVVGELLQVVGVGDPTMWDTRNSIYVNVLAGEFESRGTDAVINGANTVAVGVHGRWEIIQFVEAEMVSSTTVRLTKLLRGRRGTEVHIGTSEVGDRVVLLSDGSVFRGILQSSDIGQEYDYRATSIGLVAGGSDTQDFTGAGQALVPWAPVLIKGTRDGSGNLTITFSRRSRFGSDLTPAYQNLPLTEEPEDYEIDIIGDSDADVVRTIDTAVESATYTAAQQTTDFGSPQAGVTVKIYQISTIVGRGLAGEATI